MAAGVQMWQSEIFTEDQMVIWENRGVMAQTWVALQTYFTEKWLEQKQYSATTAKQSQFKEAVLLAQETAAAEEEGKTQVMLFAMLQNQHAKQIAQMKAREQNKHGRHDGANERSCGGGRSPTGPSAGQGEHPSRKKCHPPWWSPPSQETQAEESALSELQMFCIAQAGQLL